MGHSLLVTGYYLIRRNRIYQDLGADYFDRRDHDAVRQRLVRRLTTIFKGERMHSTAQENRPRPLFNVMDFGAVGDGQTLDTSAIQSAINACSEAGGGTVCVPPGTYVIGSVFLASDITLHIDAGATLLGSEAPADYPIRELRFFQPAAGHWEDRHQRTHAPLIAGIGLKNIAITGRGTIDARGAYWWKMCREEGMLDYPRPRLIGFADCTNVLIEGVTLTNSPSWTIHPVRCENVTVDKVTIINPPDSDNTDGINPDACRNVHISNCHIDVGDDCVTIKSGNAGAGCENFGPCENVTITNCTMLHGHGGVVIGSQTGGGVRNIVISNCVFVGTDRGIRLKSRRGNGGIVEDIRVSNIVMKKVLCPFIMNLYYGCDAWGERRISDKTPYPVTEGTPRFRRIHFHNVSVRQAQYAAAFIYGLAEMPVEEISFDDIAISMDPDAASGIPAVAPDMEPMQRAGFFACNVRGLRLHNVELADQKGAVLLLRDVSDVEVSASGTSTPSSDASVFQMTNVKAAFIHGCQAATGTDTFLQLEGDETQEIVLTANHLCRAKRAIQVGEDVDPAVVGDKTRAV